LHEDPRKNKHINSDTKIVLNLISLFTATSLYIIGTVGLFKIFSAILRYNNYVSK